MLAPGKVTGFLVELAPGATPLQARFAILSTVKGVKVVTGDSTLSGIRQGLAALLDGILALMVLMFASMAAHGERAVLGDRHRTARRARSAEGDRRAARRRSSA